MESANASEDHYRLALLLTDALGDLGINKDGSALWSPESVIQALKESLDGGISLANNLIRRLEELQGKPSDRRLQSWDGLFGFFQIYLPPWVSARDFPENPLITKLEILSFLVSTLQSRMLQKSKSAPIAPKGKEGSHELDLPECLSQDQKEIILECYSGIKEDYDKRRKGMQQRLDILVANFEAENPDETAIGEIKERLKSLSIYSPVSTKNIQLDLDEESVLKHFSSPHSMDVKRTASETAGNAAPIIQAKAENPGGKLDDLESRVSMPEWSDSKKT